MDTGAYLERIGYDGPREPGTGTLAGIHRAHMLTVPFENLDIPLGRPITLSLEAIYDKVVVRRRGGFCYELNGLFGWLLEQAGFRVELLSARVFHADGSPGPEFDHLTLRVDLDEPWIADVGFGDSFLEPLRLDGEGESEQQGFVYRIRAAGTDRILERRRSGSGWEPQYAFSLTPRSLAEFGAMCRYHQTSPESTFTQKSVCSLATPDGRVTLSNGRLIVTSGGGREEREVESPAEWRAILEARFGIVLPAGDARIPPLR